MRALRLLGKPILFGRLHLGSAYPLLEVRMTDLALMVCRACGDTGKVDRGNGTTKSCHCAAGVAERARRKAAGTIAAKPPSMSGVKARVKSSQRWLAVLAEGVEGRPYRLGAGEADAFQKFSTLLGIPLMTETAARRKGLELRRGAKPIATRYFEAPISAYFPLFCEQQFKPRAGK